MTPLQIQFITLLFACFAFLGPMSALAQTYCSAPVRPFCVSSAGVYEDKLAAERCGAEIRTYAQGMRTYAECLKKQSAEAAALAEEMERRHACMREGGGNCR
jgi:hypothetical protein